jgi:hypothetical protein
MRFSEYFDLDKKQNELDFVDVPIDTDIPLFIDPFALSKKDDEFSLEASQIVSSFFQEVVDTIRAGNGVLAKRMLAKLSEPNDTHFGLSSGSSRGKGVSGKQSVDLFTALKNSQAVKTGFIHDLQDCELVIPGISEDKISDIVTNLIKVLLISYTYEQCKLLNIPTRSVASSCYWNAIDREWEENYVDLPIVKVDTVESKVILVPKSISRYNLMFNHSRYYHGFVLEYLQRQHIRENSPLVHICKNGAVKVYKKALKARPEYRLTKEFLYNFSNDHPEVLDSYRDKLSKKRMYSITDDQIEKRQRKQKYFNVVELISKLQSIGPGPDNATTYHDAIVGILTAIFYPYLTNPHKETPLHDGRKRVDISFINSAESGFFFQITNQGIASLRIFFECKNYSREMGNPELDQMAGRFSPRRGKLGFIVCRSVQDRQLLVQRCRDTANDERGIIIILDDSDIISLLNFRKNNDDHSITAFLNAKLNELIM